MPDEKLTIMLDRERELTLNMNVLSEFEERTGKTLLNPADAANLGARDIRTLFYCALKGDDPLLTEEDVGAMLTIQRIPELARTIEALVGASGDGSEPAEEGGEDA